MPYKSYQMNENRTNDPKSLSNKYVSGMALRFIPTGRALNQ